MNSSHLSEVTERAMGFSIYRPSLLRPQRAATTGSEDIEDIGVPSSSFRLRRGLQQALNIKFTAVLWTSVFAVGFVLTSRRDEPNGTTIGGATASGEMQTAIRQTASLRDMPKRRRVAALQGAAHLGLSEAHCPHSRSSGSSLLGFLFWSFWACPPAARPRPRLLPQRTQRSQRAATTKMMLRPRQRQRRAVVAGAVTVAVAITDLAPLSFDVLCDLCVLCGKAVVAVAVNCPCFPCLLPTEGRSVVEKRGSCRSSGEKA